MLHRWPRMIALIDMNAFFASVEQLDRPEWRARAVGVTNGHKGTCIITCSYEARSYGIRTGTRLKVARQLCPHFIQAPARPERYAAVSTAIMTALENLSPDIEIFSVDEAFVDFTRCQRLYGSDARQLGQRLKAAVYEASGLLCSVGVSGDKTTAKWAAKQDKPNGLTIVAPWESEAALASVPVTELCGVKSGIGGFLAARGVHTCGEMKRLPISELGKRFGNPGRRVWLMAQGRDPEPVQPDVRPPRTLGHGKVIPPDTRDAEVLRIFYLHMAEKVARRLRKNALQARHFCVSMCTLWGWLDRKYQTRLPTDDGQAIFRLCQHFLDGPWTGEGAFQVHVCALDPRPRLQQLDLFDRTDPHRDEVNQAVDRVNSRYGEFALCRAPLMHRSTMPNVIAPAWKPYGHRESIEY